MCHLEEKPVRHLAFDKQAPLQVLQLAWPVAGMTIDDRKVHRPACHPNVVCKSQMLAGVKTGAHTTCMCRAPQKISTLVTWFSSVYRSTWLDIETNLCLIALMTPRAPEVSELQHTYLFKCHIYQERHKQTEPRHTDFCCSATEVLQLAAAAGVVAAAQRKQEDVGISDVDASATPWQMLKTT